MDIKNYCLIKRLPLIALVLLITIASCKKDPFVDLIDTWDIEGGSKGEVTFNADGTGQAILLTTIF